MATACHQQANQGQVLVVMSFAIGQRLTDNDAVFLELMLRVKRCAMCENLLFIIRQEVRTGVLNQTV